MPCWCRSPTRLTLLGMKSWPKSERRVRNTNRRVQTPFWPKGESAIIEQVRLRQRRLFARGGGAPAEPLERHRRILDVRCRSGGSGEGRRLENAAVRVQTPGRRIDESPSKDGSKTVVRAGPEATES